VNLPLRVKSNTLHRLAALFLALYSLILSLSPAVRARSWDVNYRFAHWLGYFLWLGATTLAEKHLRKKIPDSDPYIFPLASLLSGWGILSIWRLTPVFGLRQTLWFALGTALLLLGIRLEKILPTLRRYKYLLLTGGLTLTALTLLFGANPLGVGARLWLGFGGIYFQPSEPLKLLLVIYLAAYLADKNPQRGDFFPFVFPTLLLAGLALLLLAAQRDLGAASIFIMLYASILYLATDRKRVLLANATLLFTISLLGYYLIDIIHTRIAVWLSPWSDPSGSGYQIIQSLIAIANGGVLGRGAGLGAPEFVPVTHSDFIFAAIAEETGLAGTLGLLTLLGLLLSRGMVIALRASNRFQRLLAAGLTAYLGIQSLLIIGGNLRLLPLTGVTLPFISYGGSSLLTAYAALLLLLLISNDHENPTPLPHPRPYHRLGALLTVGLLAAALLNGWWAIVRGADLLTRSDNPRRAQADLYVPRGTILDRNNRPINLTRHATEKGGYYRAYLYPDLAPIVGYTHPLYGQSGIEAGLDDYLRGLAGNPASLIAWNSLLYGQPPTGLDLRLSLDLDLQQQADESLGEHQGAIVLINAASGEILVMASHPSFDPNHLDKNGATLLTDENAPLLNRATQGSYPLPPELNALLREPLSLSLRLPLAAEKENYASPLQMATIAAALSNGGPAAAPRLALAVNTPQSGWVVLPALGEDLPLFSAAEAEQLLSAFSNQKHAYWQLLSTQEQEENLTWLLAGTPSDWQGTSLALAVLLEENNPALAESIAEELFALAQK
jgi:cell division protein FtsW (lipid II flippase)